jgi:hypothetical protein
MIWLKPLLIAFTPLFLIVFLWFQSERHRKRYVTMLLVLLWFISIVPALFPIAIAFAMVPEKDISKAYSDIRDLPILTTWYDPELGGITCAYPCDQYANGERVLESHYLGGTSQTAACIPSWLGRSVTIEGLGTFRCRDTGGAIVVTYNEYYQQMVIHVDILAHPGQMTHNVYLWNEWNLK